MHSKGLLRAILAGSLCTASLGYAVPVALKTDQIKNPLGIDRIQPQFSWQSDSSLPNWLQSAYQVRVATSLAKLAQGKADVWDSGKIGSVSSIHVSYAGEPLQSQTRYYWNVTVWDNKGAHSTSQPAWFQTGIFTKAEWKAKWIYRNDPADTEEMQATKAIWKTSDNLKSTPPGTTAEFHYKLHLEEAPQSAVIHVIARGGFTTRINGTVTGGHESCVAGKSAACQMPWAAFDREIITPLLKVGDNDIAIHVTTVRPSRERVTTPAIAASIRLTRKDGSEQRIGTDTAWTSEGKPAVIIGDIAETFEHPTGAERSTLGTSRITTSASLLRKGFVLKGPVKSATLTVTALGAYHAYLNGRSVAPASILAPGFTEFSKRVQYQTYDVASLLKTGNNTLAAMLGGGWHSSPLLWVGERYFPGPDMLMAQLDITLADGEHTTIVTDESWQTAKSPIEFSEIYGGEDFDGRLLNSAWNTTATSSKAWTDAAVGTAPPDLQVTAQPDLPISTQLTVHPVAIKNYPSNHIVVYDMGQNMVGNIRLHVRGPRGTVVRMRFAERLNPDGSIYTENLRDAEATDHYILAGGGEESYTPNFTFHGFRYVELENYPGTATKASVEGLVYNSLPLAPSLTFTSSSDLLNSMGRLGIWGQRGNFFSIPTDCPQRDERMGWMGDAGVFWRTGTYNFDIAAFSHKFMDDIVDAQYDNGSFTDIAPDLLSRHEGAPGWADAGILVPYAAWLQYGDVALLQEHWDAMKKFMDFIETANPNHLRRKQLGANYADWLAPDQNTPKDEIATAYWAIIARDMVEMANALGKKDDAARFQDVYNKVAEAYRREYVSSDGTVKGNTQSAYVTTLFAGIAPEKLRKNMTERLVKDIEAHQNHLTTGFLGTPFLMFVLDENGHSDVAWKLLMQDTYPSWGYMVRKGATTWWERWNGDTGDPAMNSYNHYAFGSVMAWVFRRVSGIDTDGSGAGFQHIVVKPHFDAVLPTLHTQYQSEYGLITTDWNKATGKFTVTTPANTRATVVLPNGKTDEVGSGVHSYTVR